MTNEGFAGARGCEAREDGAGQQYFGDFRRKMFARFGGEGGPGFGGSGGPFGGRGFGHGHGGPGGRGGRGMFASGDLRFVILRLIEEKPRHGYDLIKSIEERMGGGYAPSPGVVYPMLTMLEEMGHATVEMDGTRKLYAITDAGRAALAEQKTSIDAMFARMDAVREAKGEGGGQAQRAMQNLMMVLRTKDAWSDDGTDARDSRRAGCGGETD